MFVRFGLADKIFRGRRKIKDESFESFYVDLFKEEAQHDKGSKNVSNPELPRNEFPFFRTSIYLLKHTFPTKIQQYLHVSFVYI